ncbi:MAG: hypothetical protein HY867_09595 [Chloroflexi bacterium]|nr:hypothetical protein [Chloroflexota bacterium]
MKTIENIVREIRRDLTPVFEQKLRAYLMDQDKDWLIEQIVRLTLDAHSLQEMDRKVMQEMKMRQREARIERVKGLGMDMDKLRAFTAQHKDTDRVGLTRAGLLSSDAPPKGTFLITSSQRSEAGNDLLEQAKDYLYAFLFGDESTNAKFNRVQQELLTVTIPVFKVSALDFMKATTELSAHGTWQDPESVSNDMRADNTLLQVEYGEVEGEMIGDGIKTALSIINNLEVNEQILYARMENIEQSTLIS